MECNSCEFSLTTAARMFHSSQPALDFLVQHGCLLPEEGQRCPRCGTLLQFFRPKHLYRCRGKVSDRARKTSSPCGFVASRHSGTWLGRTRLNPETTVMFVCAFLNGIATRTYARQNLSMSSMAYADWSNFIREVCVRDLEDGGSENMIGGDGVIVEIDETLLGRRKSHVGRTLMGQWILGGIERGTRKVFFAVIPDRSAETLANHIRSNVGANTTIITDCWKGYRWLQEDSSYTHLTVNHSENFVDPVSGAHTQTIEQLWREVKSSIPKYGRRMLQVEMYLGAYRWMRRFPDEGF